ncbi:MAG: SRPBCC family protein [Gaiellaceae bacterium]
MVRLHNTVVVAATPAAVWEVLGDLAATTEWLPGTVAARMDDDVRTCTTADGFEIRERISAYSDEQRTYRFEHLALPVPVRDSGGVFTLEQAGDGTRVVLETSFEPLDAAQAEQVAQMMDGALGQALESLKRRIEHGTRWDATAR